MLMQHLLWSLPANSCCILCTSGKSWNWCSKDSSAFRMLAADLDILGRGCQCGWKGCLHPQSRLYVGDSVLKGSPRAACLNTIAYFPGVQPKHSRHVLINQCAV